MSHAVNVMHFKNVSLVLTKHYAKSKHKGKMAAKGRKKKCLLLAILRQIH